MFRRNPVWTVFWEIIIENTKKNSYKSHEIPLNHHCWSNTPANIRKPAATPFGPGNGMQHLKSPLIGSRHDISTRRCPGYAPKFGCLEFPSWFVLFPYLLVMSGNLFLSGRDLATAATISPTIGHAWHRWPGVGYSSGRDLLTYE